MAGINKDLQDLAKSSTEDFYELLGVPFDANEAAIQKAYRKASIRFHPDKNPDNKDAADRFIYLGWARDILIDETLKGEYDRARTRRREKALQDELLGSRRRKMKEDLERREREAKPISQDLKRKRPEDLNDAERRELEIQRLSEDGKRRVREHQERKEKQRKQDEDEEASSFMAQQPGQTSDYSRTVKVVFVREPSTLTWDKHTIQTMFSKYGKIDSVINLAGRDKMIRISGEEDKALGATFYVVYTRLDHAYAAVLDAKADFPGLYNVSWAGGEPDCLKAPAPTTVGAGGGEGAGAPGGTPLGTLKSSFSPETPSLEEVAMMRLKQAGRKQAEKKKLEEQTRKQEAAEEQAAPGGVGSKGFSGTPLRTPKSFFGPSSGHVYPPLGPLGTPKFSFSPTTSRFPEVTALRLKKAEKKRLEEQIRKQEGQAAV